MRPPFYNSVVTATVSLFISFITNKKEQKRKKKKKKKSIFY